MTEFKETKKKKAIQLFNNPKNIPLGPQKYKMTPKHILNHKPNPMKAQFLPLFNVNLSQPQPQYQPQP